MEGLPSVPDDIQQISNPLIRLDRDCWAPLLPHIMSGEAHDGSLASMGLPPTGSQSPSRSLSRSPTRRNNRLIREIDPLLSDLSPTTTLEALAAPSTSVSAQDTLGTLDRTVVQASMAERDFGMRTALASKKIRQWYAEVSAWDWPLFGTPEKSTGFEVLTREERARKRRRLSEETQGQSKDIRRDPAVPICEDVTVAHRIEDTHEEPMVDPVDEFWGGYPAQLVLLYQDRIDEIRSGIKELDIEDLEERLLGMYPSTACSTVFTLDTDQIKDAHVPSRSRPSSFLENQAGLHSTSSIVHLDDFTAIVTATLLQALPILSRLTSLLETWFTRLAVLRMVPSFLKGLEDAQVALRSGWHALDLRDETTAPGRQPYSQKSDEDPVTDTLPATVDGFGQSDLTREGFDTIRTVLADKIVDVGRYLDRMLDILEGRDDTIPTRWIEEMEDLEEVYGSWVSEAERVVLQNELRRARRQDRDELMRESLRQQSSSDVHRDSEQTNSETIDEYAATNRRAFRFLDGHPSSSGDSLDILGMTDEIGVAGPNGTAHLFESNSVVDLLPSATTSPGDLYRLSILPSSEECSTQIQPLDHGTNGVASSVLTETNTEQALLIQSNHVLQADEFAPQVVSFQGKSSRSQHTTQRPKSAPPSIVDKVSWNQMRKHQFNREQKGLLDGQSSLDSGIRMKAVPASVNENSRVKRLLRPVNGTDVRYNLFGNVDRFGHPIRGSSLDRRSSAKETDGKNESRFGPDSSVSSNASQWLDHLPNGKFEDSTSVSSRFRGRPRQNVDLNHHLLDSSLEAPSCVGDAAAKRPTPILITDQISPTSVTFYLSEVSSPVLQDAFAAVSHKPVFVSSRPSISRGITTPVGDQQASTRARDHESISRVTRMALRDRSQSYPARSINDDLNLFPPKRASVASLEFIEKASIKSIEVRRKGSQLSMRSSPSRDPLDHGAIEASPASLAHAEKAVEPLESTLAQDPSSLAVKGPASKSKAPDARGSRLASKAAGKGQQPKQRVKSLRKDDPNLQSKPRLPKKPSTTPKPMVTTGNSPSAVGSTTSSTTTSPLVSREEQLEQKISSILTSIPAQIRLTTEDEGGERPSSSSSTSSKQREPLMTPKSNIQSGTPRSCKTPPFIGAGSNSYTLAAAARSRTSGAAVRATGRTRTADGSENNGHPEVKLYHLRRRGAEAAPPIKLFVRLVGTSENNERVMVRVGGGWADLKDYLWEYATHHSRRSSADVEGGVGDAGSGAKVEVRQLPIPKSGGGGGISTPASATSTSRLEHRQKADGRNTPGSTGNSSNGTRSLNQSSRPRSSGITNYDLLQCGTPGTPTPMTISNVPSIINTSASSSVTSTPDNRPQPEPSSDNDNTKKPSVSSAAQAKDKAEKEKQAWVEAMIGKVRRSAAVTNSPSHHPSPSTTTSSSKLTNRPKQPMRNDTNNNHNNDDNQDDSHDDNEHNDNLSLSFGELGRVGGGREDGGRSGGDGGVRRVYPLKEKNKKRGALATAP